MSAHLVKDAIKSIGYLVLLAATTYFMGPWFVVSFVAFIAFLCLVDDAFDEARSGKHYLANVLFFIVTLAAALYLPLAWFLLAAGVALVALLFYRK